jgi:hypothetical protein
MFSIEWSVTFTKMVSRTERFAKSRFAHSAGEAIRAVWAIMVRVLLEDSQSAVLNAEHCSYPDKGSYKVGQEHSSL